jgi:hypothetical protein
MVMVADGRGSAMALDGASGVMKALRSYVLIIVLLVCSGCAEQDWGPLAVVSGDTASSSDVGLGGIVRIADDCTIVESDSRFRTTLVWPSRSTEWDANTQTIRLRQPDGDVAIVDGDHFSFGGSDEVSGAIRWVAEPGEHCPKARFIVGYATRS